MFIRNNKLKIPDPYLWLVLLIHRQPADVPIHESVKFLKCAISRKYVMFKSLKN